MNGVKISPHNVRAMPAFFLMDKKGRILNTHVNFSNNLKSKISAQIERII